MRTLICAWLLALAAPAVHAAVAGGPPDDETLAQEVHRRIQQAWVEESSSLRVAASDGLVVLTGEAPSAVTARQAADIAEATPGVTEVVNRLEARQIYER